MTRPRKTWQSRPGPEIATPKALDDIAEKYGSEVAALVARSAGIAAWFRALPTRADVQTTLKAIANEPSRVGVSKLDGFTCARLATAAGRQFHTGDIASLTRDQSLMA